MTERLYSADSFLRTFSAHVADIREASRTDGVSVWQIALDRSAFYPTSGGQPCDTGILTANSRGGAVLEIPIESVEEDEEGTVWHFTRKPLAAGVEVQGTIDWPRRLDHIQQHSGQHLLSAVFARELIAPTVSFHLGDAVSYIDLTTGPIAHHSLERVERIANELIAEDREVAVRVVNRPEAEALLAAGKLRKLPQRMGDIRLIEIADYDLNACGGTHVCSTGQIGGLLVRGVEKVSRGFRVSFVCGLRAAAAARRDFDVLTRASAALSAGADEIPPAIERLRNEAKAGEKERQRLREELAGYHASRLAVEEPPSGGLRFVRRVFPDRDPDYVRLLASKLAASAPRTVALLASAESWPARVVLARSRDLDFHCGNLLKEVLAAHGLRGGGSPDLAQTDLAEDQLESLAAELEKSVRSRCAPRAAANP
ncbi:MAG TPA: DHHA1 domain-containing protein [Acidobacteriaceae bacterium]|nr:DHHA1 domain-containing protein [Acidobacteriaceae bacterium]